MSLSGFSSTPSGLMRRREARRIAMTILYAQASTGYHQDEVIALLRGMRDDWTLQPHEFAIKLAQSVQLNGIELETEIQAVLENWRFDRISLVERALLLLGCAEILYFPDIPPRVTINEYIELAKAFSNENAPSFINGILDKLVHKTAKPDIQKR